MVAVSDLVVGKNRFALGILDNTTKQPVPDATVRFRFVTLSGSQATVRFESDGRFVAPARDAGVPRVTEHRHADGTIHPHANAESDVGVYVANVEFDQPGQWGVQTLFRTKDGREGTINAAFEVAKTVASPVVGQPALRTVHPTAKDVKDLSEISSSDDPNPAFHQTTIAAAIAAGKPVVIGFLTPGYCATQFCGPVYEVMEKLLPKYQDKAAFIHIEVWKDPLKKIPADAFAEWKLTTEPQIYIVDKNGIITAHFQGPVGLAELDEAVAAVTR